MPKSEELLRVVSAAPRSSVWLLVVWVFLVPLLSVLFVLCPCCVCLAVVLVEGEMRDRGSSFVLLVVALCGLFVCVL